MEHSIQKYLQRQTTQKLEMALQTCLQDKSTANNKEMIHMILEILQKRGVNISHLANIEI